MSEIEYGAKVEDDGRVEPDRVVLEQSLAARPGTLTVDWLELSPRSQPGFQLAFPFGSDELVIGGGMLEALPHP